MRIIAGKFKGKRLDAVPGKSTRPTTDRVKEAWMSSIYSMIGDSLSAAKVLDAFAGSGALGLELLSRGAANCIFCDNRSAALKTLKQNIQSIGLDASQARVLNVDSLTAALPGQLKDFGPFDIVVLDPPYSYQIAKLKELLTSLAMAGLIRIDTVISYEHAANSDSTLNHSLLLAKNPSISLDLVSQKTYGTIGIDYYRCQ
jgi:16S rRNA (guanine966-N2)-methyltransferase